MRHPVRHGLAGRTDGGRRLVGLYCTISRRRAGRRSAFLGYRRYDAKTSAMNGPDAGLGRAVIADRLTNGLDPAAQRGIRNAAAVPDVLDDLVLGDDAIPALEKIDQQVKDLRLDRDHDAIAANFIGASVN